MKPSLYFTGFLSLTLLLRPIGAPTAAEVFAADRPGPIAVKLQPFVDHHTLAGAVVLVASSDKILAVETVGYADIEAGKLMQPNSMFWIASQSKAMTAAALMMLVDEGKVKVDDPVEKYLPEFKGQMVTVEHDAEHTLLKKPTHPITIRNVLTHTSGMAFASAIEKPTLDGLPLSVAVKSYAMTPLQWEPDTKYQYANSGINIAARIVEVVSRMPYEQFMDERLFKPLGMKDTTFWPTDEQLSRLARTYHPNQEKTNLEPVNIGQLIYPLTDHQHRFPMPAGGLFSTAGDTAIFCQMLLRGGEYNGKRVLSESAVQQMTCSQDGGVQNKSGKGENGYGYGLQTTRKVAGDPKPGSGGSFGHGGANSTNMQIDPEHNLVLIYMVQHAGYANEDGKQIVPLFHKMGTELHGAR